MRVLIHPLFFVVMLVAFFFSAGWFFAALVVAVIAHEFGHMLAARWCGVNASRIALTPFGGAVSLQTSILTERQRAAIFLAGPITSLLLTLFFGTLVWLFPVAFGVFEYLVAANFLVGIINILPIYPLDGGKLLANYLRPKYILIWSNLIFALILLIALIKFNFAFIAFASIMLIQINWEFKTSNYQDKFSYRGKQKIGKFIRCAVLTETSLWAAYHLIDRKRPTEFVVIDGGCRVFYEKDLERWLATNHHEQTIRQCLNK